MVVSVEFGINLRVLKSSDPSSLIQPVCSSIGLFGSDHRHEESKALFVSKFPSPESVSLIEPVQLPVPLLHGPPLRLGAT